MNKILAKILEDEPVVRPIVKLHAVEPKRKPFNEQRREIRALIETAWLRPYHQAAMEIENRMGKTIIIPDPNGRHLPTSIEKPEKLPLEAWIKELPKPWGYRTGKSLLDFWSACIADNLGMDGYGPSAIWKFKWGKATFKINNDLKSVYTFYKALNKRI
jgi:hypothetical protein